MIHPLIPEKAVKDIAGREIFIGDSVAISNVFGEYKSSKLDVCTVTGFTEKMVKISLNGRNTVKMADKMCVIIKSASDPRLV